MTKTITISPEEMCKRRGNATAFTGYKYSKREKVILGYYGCMWYKILSINDKIEMDECACGHEIDMHDIDLRVCNVLECRCEDFKRLLATVKGIRIVAKDKIELELI